MAKPLKINLLDFAGDPNLLDLSLSDAQETLLRAVGGLSLKDKHQLDIFRSCTGLDSYQPRSHPMVTLISGARAGKDSRIIPAILIHAAVTGDHSYLSPGERVWFILIAQGHRGSIDISFSYILGLFEASPMLSGLIEDQKAYELKLTNRAAFAGFPCTQYTSLGYGIGGSGLSEVAYFKTQQGTNNDREIVASIRRGMAMAPEARLIKASAPYLRSGEVWKDFQTGYGVEGAPTLVWKCPSWVMNPNIPAGFLEAERARDPELFDRNFGAEFIDTVTQLFVEDALGACVVTGRRELSPLPDIIYIPFIDFAGGTGTERTGLSFGHLDLETGQTIIDLLRSWSPPFNPLSVVAEVVEILKQYGCRTVTGDRYSAGFIRDAFAVHGITYEPSPLDKSGLYHELLPAINSNRVELLDHPELLRELRGLERRRGGPSAKDRIDHTPGGKDDLANCVAGVVALLAQMPRGPVVPPAGVGRRSAWLGAEQSAEEYVPWSSRGTQGVPDRWGDW